MKRTILIISLLLACLCAQAQEAIDCFSIHDGEVIWQEVYQSDMDSTAVVAALVKAGEVTGITGVPGGIVCRILPQKMDYKAAGFQYKQVAVLVYNYDLEGRAHIEFRDGRYRVTVSQIHFVPLSSAAAALGGTNLETVVGKDGKFIKAFHARHTDEIIDYTLNRLFEFAEIPEEEW